MKISGVYKITNAVTGDFYIGSSNDVKRRWKEHKCTSRWNKCPNNPMYIDMRKYRVDKFEMQIIAEVEEEKLKETEQQFIEKLNPTYNSCNAKGRNIERRKKYDKEYQNQLCFYNGETITLRALAKRFWRQGIDHPTIEAKKYLI